MKDGPLGLSTDQQAPEKSPTAPDDEGGAFASAYPTDSARRAASPSDSSRPMPAVGTPRGVSGYVSRLASDRTLVLAALIIMLTSYLFGEKIPVNNGFGFDGNKYGRMAQDFYNEVLVQGVDDYNVQRTLPSAVVYVTLRALAVPLTHANVVLAFAVLNALLVAFSAHCWCRIANELGISFRGKLLGFAGLFLNFALLKCSAYMPVTTDVMAFALGLFMLDGYLSGQPARLYVSMVLGTFVWPPLPFLAAVLLLFPRERGESGGGITPRWRLHAVLAVGVCLGLVLCDVYLIRKGYTGADGQQVAPVYPWIAVSIGIAVAYLFAGLCLILRDDRLFDPAYWWRHVRVTRWLLVFAVLLGSKYLSLRLSNGEHLYGPKVVVAYTAFSGIARPGLFLLAHVLYFGPVFLLALFLWRPTCRLLHRHGLGLTLCAALGLVLSLNAESRHIIVYYAFLVPFVVKVTDSLPWGAWQYAGVIALTVLSSKVWFPINQGPFRLEAQEFPDQYFFMNAGPWMSNDMYQLQGVVVLLAALVVYAACFWKTGGQAGAVPAEVNQA